MQVFSPFYRMFVIVTNRVRRIHRLETPVQVRPVVPNREAARVTSTTADVFNLLTLTTRLVSDLHNDNNTVHEKKMC